MDEEQAVLNFFAKTENLPLGLSVAEQMDKLREQMNNRLWQVLTPRLDALIKKHGMTWQVELTEDRNAPDALVGLYCTPHAAQAGYLRPMMEQQYLGGVWRIYFGLMWNVAPSSAQLELPAVRALKASLLQAGFKNNANFLGWQWTAHHPRRKDFLLRYAEQPEKTLNNMEAIFKTLLIEHREAIEQANAALKNVPPGLNASLSQLRDQLIE